jgi:hypothetical protein
VLARFGFCLFLAVSLQGCLAYEFDHEFWLKVDGSGTVNVTGRPDLWTAFKGLPAAADEDALRQGARAAFEASGLRVRRVTVTSRGGRRYLFVSADFPDVNRLGDSAAFKDLRIGMRREGETLVLEGRWQKPTGTASSTEPDGLMAVRFHLPSKIHAHKNAFAGIERGNIASWRQDVAQGLSGSGLDFGVTMDRRSILNSTVTLFAGAIVVALAIFATAFYVVVRRGRRSARLSNRPS